MKIQSHRIDYKWNLRKTYPLKNYIHLCVTKMHKKWIIWNTERTSKLLFTRHRADVLWEESYRSFQIYSWLDTNLHGLSGIQRFGHMRVLERTSTDICEFLSLRIHWRLSKNLETSNKSVLQLINSYEVMLFDMFILKVYSIHHILR